MNGNRVCISQGNRKMGAIPSVSLPACITCNPNAPCIGKCYAIRVEKRYPNVRNSYFNNLEILRNDPDSYWVQVKAGARIIQMNSTVIYASMSKFKHYRNIN